MENTVSIVARTPVQSTSNVSNDDILPSSRILKEVYLSENLQSNTLVDSTIKPNHTQLADAAAGVLQSGLDRDKGSQSDVVDSTPQVARVDNIATMCEDGDVVVVDATPVRALLERDIKGEAEYARKAIQTKTTAINTKTDKAEAPETGSSNSEKKGEKLKESEHVQSTSVYKSGIKVASDSKDVDTSTPQPGEDICTEGIGASVRVPATTTNPNAKPEVRTSTRVSRSAAQASVPTASLNKMHTRASAGDNAGVRPKRGTVGSRKGADTKSGVTKVPAEAAKNKKGKAAAKVKTQPSVAKAKKITPFSTAKKVVAQKPKDLSPFLVSSSKEHDPKATPFSAGLKRPHSDHTTTPSKTVLDLTGESTQVVDVMGEQPSDSKRLKPTTVEIGTTAPTDGAGASVPENKEKSPQKTTSAQEKEKVAHTPSNADKTSTTSQTTETTDSAKTRTGTKAISTSDDTDPIASTPEETHSQTQNIDIHADKTDIADTQERESRKRKASEREGVVAVQSESVSTSATPANAGKLKPTAERSVTRESTEGSSLEQTPAGIPSENQEKPSTATVSKKRRASAISAGSAKNSVSKKEGRLVQMQL
ncbi:hypothetical protein SARC_04556 [Sphaeroforma arctica JP610]|uniref:Uncharacterized protein n=1 Tax=Sphaeroforma arctica JP610 TaxID=667725 RepID=A0A0L0G2X0_9EUKA|nr:hypothetical protein SARC_04556 [Sphaeroforma arctica JP610]KNC83189.1 hypothetical protein SARC_04556 [Sphaeroforma arctica JP610]|eukprot:XP_014157091.1 hypothetical protein SARC_04556 [Sphaeroforma arctica JP610]